MTPEQINQAIAAACGWRAWAFGDPLIEKQRFADTKFNGYVRKIERVYGTRGATLDVDESPIYDINLFGRGREYEPLSGWLSPDGRWKVNPPDYYANLNAMHEAELSLNDRSPGVDQRGNPIPSDRARYRLILCEVTFMRGGPIHASAAQRAEAFLRTLNLWEAKP